MLQDERREKLRREILDFVSEWSATSAEKARVRIAVPAPGNLTITIDDANTATSDFTAVLKETVDTLSRNAVLDREELDFLWWAQLGSSRLLKRQLSDIAEPVRIVAAGLEGAKILRRFPCEVNREIVLRTLDQNPEFDLSELLLAIGEDYGRLSAAFPTINIASHPTVFPLLHALFAGITESDGASLKRSLSEWGERALLEATFVNIMSSEVRKI
jgi:hypothetical protein